MRPPRAPAPDCGAVDDVTGARCTKEEGHVPRWLHRDESDPSTAFRWLDDPPPSADTYMFPHK